MKTYQQVGGLDLVSLRERMSALTSTTTTVVEQAVERHNVETAERQITVPAFERERQFWTIDKSGQRVPGGVARRRDYDTDRKVAHATMHGFDGRDYVIGQVGQMWSVVDHADVIEPLMQAGMTNVQLLNHRSGGTSVLAMLSNPDVQLKDVIGWDHDLLTRHGRSERTGVLELGARISSSLRYGEAIHIEYGFWRIDCQNGMMTNVLGLGGHTFNHTSFGRYGEDGRRIPMIEIGGRVERLTDEIDQAGGDVLRLPKLAPRLPSVSLDWTIDMLQRYEEDGAEAFAGLPDFARVPLEGLVQRMPTWSPRVLTETLQAARQDDGVGVLDIVNAVTNVATLQPARIQSRMGDAPSWGIYDRLNPLAQALKDTIEIGAFKASVDWSKN